MVRAYLVLGLVEGLTSMAGYLLVWHNNGVDLAALQQLAPDLLHHRAAPAVQAIQHQASTVAFCLIVAGQMGALLACRSDRRPFWELLSIPNPLLWLGLAQRTRGGRQPGAGGPDRRRVRNGPLPARLPRPDRTGTGGGSVRGHLAQAADPEVRAGSTSVKAGGGGKLFVKG